MARKKPTKSIEEELAEMDPIPVASTGTKGWFGEMKEKDPEQFAEIKRHITIWVSDTAGKSMIRQKLPQQVTLYKYMAPKIEAAIGRRPSKESFGAYVKKVEASLG